MKLHRNFLMTLVAGAVLAAPAHVPAQEDVGPFGDADYGGAYQDGVGQDDWFYDRYDAAGEDTDVWWSETEWYSEFYSGLFDDAEQGAEDDWFFDTYDDPGEEGLFDV